MPIARRFLFVTLVLATSSANLLSFTARAAKTSDVLIFDREEKQPSTHVPPGSDLGDKKNDHLDGWPTLDFPISTEPTRTAPSTEYYYPHRQALAARLGIANRTGSVTDTNAPYLAGIQFFFQARSLATFEVGADLFSDGTGMFRGGRRWVFGNARVRPFATGGAALIVNPKDQLASFIRYDQVLVMGAAGVESFYKDAQSWRIEFEFGAGIKTLQAIASIGYVWGW